MSPAVPTPYVIYAVVVVLAGASGLAFSGDSRMRRLLPATLISLCSILMVVYLLWTFRGLGQDVAVRLIDWQLPFAAMDVGIDPLSGFFLIPLLILATSCSLYGPWYFGTHPAGRSHWFFFGLLLSGMVVVLLARNAVLFLLAWEAMSLASFFLVITDKENPETMRAGWIYFITSHVGTAVLLGLFFFMASLSGSFDFIAWKSMHFVGRTADILFVLALVAFGVKAGFIPFHVWLPLAHPAAPSHVSALMSGIMIKMGIYGLLRILTFIAPYHAWWGSLLIALGMISGVLGVLFAIGQHDIKRLLAYHSVENIGIILLGIGVGITGAAYGSNVIALFGFAGALLHVVNHALFKGLLFLGAGSVIRQTGSGDIDRLGGLIKTMPGTAVLFLTASVAICGLPFFNGFVSELMIYVAGIGGAARASDLALSTTGLVGIVSLALIGGLAAACFAKVFGVAFLGEPRTETVRVAGDVPVPMLGAMGLLAALCIVIGMGSPFILPFLVGPALLFAGPAAGEAANSLTSLSVTISLVLCSFVIAVAVITALTKVFLRKGRSATGAVTWDCGYSRPGPSMQYTASSFAAPIVNHFKISLAARRTISSDGKLFPGNGWSFHSAVEDWFLTRLYAPAIESFDRLFSSLRWFQSGKAGQYVLYIAITVFCLILWKFFL